MKAVVLLRGSPDALKSALGGGSGVVVKSLGDAVLVATDLSMRSLEPAELAVALASQLGEAIAKHDDARGLFVFPSVVQPKGQSYDAVLEEVAEAGEWLSAPGESAAAAPPDLEALMGGMMQAFGPQLMDLARGMMEQNPDLARQLQGGPMDFDSLAQKAQQLMKDNPNLVGDVARRLGRDESDDDE